MAFHAENNWFRSAEKLISTDFCAADASEGDAPLGTPGGGVRISVGPVADAPGGAAVGPVAGVAGDVAATGTAWGIIRKPESMSISSSPTIVLKRRRASGT